jgi:hypothetical protein
MPIMCEEGIIGQFKRGAQHFPAGSVEINEKPSVGTVGVAVNLAPSYVTYGFKRFSVLSRNILVS